MDEKGDKPVSGEMAKKTDALILMGIKHCGKSTQGRLLSRHFACPFYDTDDLIQNMTGKSPRQIYTEQGEDAFIAAEEAACAHLASLLSQRRQPAAPYAAVVATGGGICKNEKAIALLRNMGILVFLQAEEKIAADRIVREALVSADGSVSNLPAYIARENPQTLDDVRASFHRFYEERTKKYSAICDLRVALNAAPPEANMHCIIKKIRG